ncbi:MAG: protein translocase subunit SecF [Oscillospiraceae bacterium]
MSKKKETIAPMAQNVKVIDFVGKRKVFFMISSVLIILTLLSCFIFGVTLSIEFKGGTLATYSYKGTVSESELQKLASDTLKTDTTVQLGETFTGENITSFTVSFSIDEPFSVELQDTLMKELTAKYPDAQIELLESNDIAPSSGKVFFIKCIVAALFATILLIVYIAWRFKRISGWSAGVFAIVALVHDLTIVFGAFVILGFEIDSIFMAVVLTILGYSVNDTIVIYDRIRENQKLMPKMPLAELVNLSLSQTIRRTIRTSITTISSMIIVSIVALVCNVSSILSFSLPMIIGMLSGSYSSICLAPILWVTWKNRSKEA